MIRTTCPKCGREDAVADYLAVLPILCNGCGTRVTIGEPIVAQPVVPPPPPPPKVPPPPKPKAEIPPPPPPKIEASPPPPPKPAPPLPPKVAVPPPPKATPKPKPAAPPPPVAPPVVALMEEPPVEMAATTETPLELPTPVLPPTPAKGTAQQAEEPPFPLPLAGVGRRLLARFLMLLGLALTVGLAEGILIFLPGSVKRDPIIMWSILAALPVIYLMVNAVMLTRTGQDIGKRYAGIRVVNADGNKANEKTALLKRDALTFVIGLTGIGVLYWLADFVTLFGKGGRTLHDRIAGTRVVRA